MLLSLLSSTVPLKLESTDQNWTNRTVAIEENVPKRDENNSKSPVKAMDSKVNKKLVAKASKKRAAKTARVRFTDEQNQILSAQFEISDSLEGVDHHTLRQKTGMTKNQIRNWFGRKNRAEKKKQLNNMGLTTPAQPTPNLTISPPSPVFSNIANAFYLLQYLNPTADATSFFAAMNSAPSLAPVFQQTASFLNSLSQASAPELRLHTSTGIVQPAAPVSVNERNYRGEMSNDEIIDIEN